MLTQVTKKEMLFFQFNILINFKDNSKKMQGNHNSSVFIYEDLLKRHVHDNRIR